MPVFRNTTARYWSSPSGVNCAPTAAGAGAVTTPSAPTAAVIALMPAAEVSSVVLVTTSTLYGSTALRFRVCGRRGQQGQARKSQTHTSPPHRLSNRRVTLS